MVHGDRDPVVGPGCRGSRRCGSRRRRRGGSGRRRLHGDRLPVVLHTTYCPAVPERVRAADLRSTARPTRTPSTNTPRATRATAIRLPAVMKIRSWKVSPERGSYANHPNSVGCLQTPPHPPAGQRRRQRGDERPRNASGQPLHGVRATKAIGGPSFTARSAPCEGWHMAHDVVDLSESCPSSTSTGRRRSSRGSTTTRSRSSSWRASSSGTPTRTPTSCSSCLAGELIIQLRDGDVRLSAGQLFVVPRGVEHCPIASEGEVHAVLIEPTGVVNTGDAGGLLTATYDDSLA